MNWWHLLLLIISFAFGIETGKIRPNFDEIFGKEWENNENDREENGIKSIDQLQNDQNIIKSDQNTKMKPNDQRKREIIQKFETILEKLRQKGKYQRKNSVKIEWKIGKLLGANRQKIYKWKKEMNLNKNKMKKNFYEEKKRQFIERFDEFKILYGQGKQKEFVKELGISYETFWKWKKELMPIYNKTSYSNENKLQKIKKYFKIKELIPKISDEIIAKKLGIGYQTLNSWKKKFASFQ